MIISLEDAEKINSDVTQDDLDGLEISIRELTNNPFQNHHVKVTGYISFTKDTINTTGETVGFRKCQTIQVSDSKYNDGLYVIEDLNDDFLKVANADFITCRTKDARVTLVEYPKDIISGVRKLLGYDAKMKDKTGLKSRTVSRLSETYFDQNAGESVNGYPAALMAFITKYRKIRW